MVDFYKEWYTGFEEGLKKMESKSRTILLTECGHACSESYTKQEYIDAYSNSLNITQFFENLRRKFPELIVEPIEDGKTYDFVYSFCACDLVKKRYIKSPLMCECSKQSLLYNLETVFGKGKVNITLLQSILGGSNSCRLRFQYL